MPLFPSPRPQHRPLAGIVPSLGACGTGLLAWYFAPCPAGAKARRVYKWVGRKTTKLGAHSGSGRRRAVRSDFCPRRFRLPDLVSCTPVNGGPGARRLKTRVVSPVRNESVFLIDGPRRFFGDFLITQKVTRPGGRNIPIPPRRQNILIPYFSLVSFTRNSVISSSFIPREALTRKVESF